MFLVNCKKKWYIISPVLAVDSLIGKTIPVIHFALSAYEILTPVSSVLRKLTCLGLAERR